MKFDDCDLMDHPPQSRRNATGTEPAWVTTVRLAAGAVIVAALAIAAVVVKDTPSDQRLASANLAFAAVVARDTRDCTPSIIGRGSCLRSATERPAITH
jgi:hypothetical protein